MKILFYDTKPYDKDSFEQCLPNFSDITIDYLKTDISPKTASLAKGYEAICAFVSSDLGTETLDVLHECGVKLILLRCAGFNNVNLDIARKARHDRDACARLFPRSSCGACHGSGPGCQPSSS